MNIAIVEDQPAFQEQLIGLIKEWNKSHELNLKFNCFSSCLQFIENYNHDYDVIFMDILLPDGNGMETAKVVRLEDKNVPIIFITSTASYAHEGYDSNALYYIIKPPQQSDINKCMDRICGICAKNEYVVTLINNQTYKIKYSNILYLESQGHYMMIYTHTGQLLCRKKLGQAIEELPEIFVRCHRSFIVNINHVVAISRKDVTLSTGNTITMSNSYQDNIAKKFIECSKGILRWG